MKAIRWNPSPREWVFLYGGLTRDLMQIADEEPSARADSIGFGANSSTSGISQQTSRCRQPAPADSPIAVHYCFVIGWPSAVSVTLPFCTLMPMTFVPTGAAG